MNRLTAFLRLTRIEHSAMLVVAVLVAEIITKSLPHIAVLLLSIVTPIFISMGSFAINDYFDVEADRINNRFDRPIVSGAISRNAAFAIAMVSFAIGILASLFINYIAFAIALVFGALAFFYSYKLKDTLLLGNSYIALSMAIPFLYGDFVVSNALNPNIAIISAIIFLSGLAREIHGMIRDYKGDSKARKSRNLLSHMGKAASSALALLLYIAAIVLSLFMFVYEKPFAYNLVYLAPILITDAALLYVSFAYLRSKLSANFFRIARNLSLGAMALALFAYLIAALFYLPI